MYKKSKHTKVRYDKVGEPRDNKRVKAHVGDVIEMYGTGVRGQVVRITHSKKWKYNDWYYKIQFENGKEQWPKVGLWRIIKDANKDR